MASSAASSFSSSFTQQWRYDVFLSFRGEDTRKNFTSHLYKELLQKGIITFKDNNELPKGESVPQYLPKAIQDSRISVVIFSENYAASTWCLNELVKIFECKNAGTQIVLPIFYDVNPYEVRQQDGKFGEPFIEYEKIFKDNIEKVQEWRLASTEVANLAGWHLGDRDESEFIQDIVEDILRQLRRTSHHSIAKDFVGMESRLEKMKGYLDLEQLSKVRIIGICGMGGIGKTTIASVVYKDIRCQFEGSCFLGNVRESFEKYGIVSLQKQLLSATLMYDGVQVYDVYRGTDEIRDRLCCKKILVILDDVDQLEQLELLIGKRDEHWFGTGSRIIITTRDVHLLKKYGTDEIYLVQGLSHGESFKLFCSKAFKSNYPKEEYVEPSNEFVKYSSGLPLALVVLGSSLFGKGVREWNSTLRRLKEIPNEKILSKLQLSYDGLDKILQEMFLDIACFFKGMDEEYVVKVLESCGFFPDSGIGELIDKSLITVSGFVEMHDLVQEMGREIVRRESNENPGLHSRIWFDKDLYYIQVKNMETKQVKAIVLHSWKLEEHLNAKVFSKMKELRLLILRDVPTSQEVEYLSNELRYLEWHECPCKTFPSNFQPDKLVELHMQCSRIEQLWRRSIKPIKLLKIIDLSYSKNLLKTPNFQEVPNLEELNLEGCESLREIHQSIGVLKRLEFSATGFGMQQLELAKRWGFHLLSWLLPWTWKNPHPISIVFPSLSALPFLNNLNLSYCDLPEGAIPSDLTGFPFLEHLDLSGNNFESLPSSISHLSHLRSLELSNCKRLQLLPDLPSTIITLRVNNCTSLESLPNLHEKHNNPLAILMEFSNCSKLNDYQGNINVAFTWLKSHLLFLLESRWLLSSRHARYCPKKGYFLDDSPLLFFLDISMRFPGSEIPKWFNHQSFNSPLRIRLSACEKWWNIAGFVICVAISSKTVYQGPELCKFTIYKKRKEVWESYFSLKVPSNVRLTSDHLHIFSVANPIPIDPYEEESTAEVELTFREYIIKRCGIRIVHLKEIKELIQTNEPLNPFENCQENSYSGEEDDDPVRGDFLWKTIPIENWRIEYWGSYLQLIYTSGREDFVWTSIKIESWGIEYWGSYGRMVTLEGSIWKDRDWEKEWHNQDRELGDRVLGFIWENGHLGGIYLEG
ncbi:disease resistance protein RUN1 [Jatropha curcas]|uniref:disease resistance protein RUN1 n=1 Tax=Jatropha curcas TaxID=180498 RepID=UPI0018957D46|nr:disease resistance protein RUN1 [Jatropha curcas]